MKSFASKSAVETKSFAASLASDLLNRPLGKKALVIPLVGDLGAGKTTFVKGFISGFGIRSKVLSPTFVIIKRYPIKKSGSFKNIYHLDCYRIKDYRDLEILGIKEIIADPQNIVLIEWPENAGPYGLGKSITLLHKHEENSRNIRVSF